MAAPASSRKAKAPPAPTLQPPEHQGIWLERLEKLGKLGALGTTLGAAVAGLGFVTLRAREALLGSPDLSYPYQEWLVTGFSALASLFWRGVSVLVSNHPVLRGSAWALLFLLLGLVLAARLKRRPALLLGILGASVLLLVVGSGFYRIALAATAAPNASPSRGARCGETLSRNLADRAAFETCSWLVNDSPRNDMRRSDFGGLLGWLLAVCLTAAVAGARASIGSRRLSLGHADQVAGSQDTATLAGQRMVRKSFGLDFPDLPRGKPPEGLLRDVRHYAFP
jgi:hypothetical protein